MKRSDLARLLITDGARRANYESALWRSLEIVCDTIRTSAEGQRQLAQHEMNYFAERLRGTRSMEQRANLLGGYLQRSDVLAMNVPDLVEEAQDLRLACGALGVVPADWRPAYGEKEARRYPSATQRTVLALWTFINAFFIYSGEDWEEELDVSHLQLVGPPAHDRFVAVSSSLEREPPQARLNLRAELWRDVLTTAWKLRRLTSDIDAVDRRFGSVQDKNPHELDAWCNWIGGLLRSDEIRYALSTDARSEGRRGGSGEAASILIESIAAIDATTVMRATRFHSTEGDRIRESFEAVRWLTVMEKCDGWNDRWFAPGSSPWWYAKIKPGGTE